MPGPFVEELANSASAPTPGWAYIVDTGYDPSKAPILPSGARQRQSRGLPVAGKSDLSVRQQTQISKRLQDLQKENHRDGIHIGVPNRPRDPAARSLQGKMTAGVKKIVLSQKTFANHLDDEEAALTNQSTADAAAMPPAKRQPLNTPGRGKSSTAASTPAAAVDDPMDVDVEDDAAAAGQDPGHRQRQQQQQAISDLQQLLNPRAPAKPSQAELDDLVAAPSLSYSAAGAGPSMAGVRARQFCEMCGYWGLVRCSKCGVRVCGLECQTQHLETRRCQNHYG